MTASSSRVGRVVLLLVLAAIVTLTLQGWVGNATIYSDDLKVKREEIHEAILANRAPYGGTWAQIGAQTTNQRVGAVYLAEGVHRVTGLRIGRCYQALDTFFLFAALVALTVYLRHWVHDELCVIGLLYCAAILPLTYFLHAFHPWDRPQLLLWIVMLMYVRDHRFVPLLITLAVSIVVKFDAILLPGLWFFVHVSRRDWRPVVAQTAVLGVTAVGIYAFLVWSLPAPNEPPRFAIPVLLNLVHTNLATMLSMNVRYPPLLAFGLPVLLALVGLTRRDRFVAGSVLFAGVMASVWFLTTHAEEARAEMPLLVLVLPAALISARGWLGGRVPALASQDRPDGTQWKPPATSRGRKPT